MQRWFNEGNRRAPGKPGEFYNNLPEDQKAILRTLKSSDINIRFNAIKNFL